MTEGQVNPQATARSPMAGCTILIVALGVMIFLVVFSVFSLFRQFKEIVKSTDDKPADIQVVSLEGRESEINSFSERLELFQQQLSDKVESRLELSPADINLAIAVYEPFAELRRTFWVESLEDGVMRIRVSYTLNGMPRLSRDGEEGFLSNDPRYLNGVMVARPVLSDGQIVLTLDDIEVKKAEVPDEFVQQMSPYKPTERYIGHKTLGPAMAQLTRVSIEDGKLVLLREPGKTPASELTEEQVSQGVSRFLMVFGGAASLFLLFAAVMIFMGLRAKNHSGGA